MKIKDNHYSNRKSCFMFYSYDFHKSGLNTAHPKRDLKKIYYRNIELASLIAFFPVY